MELEDLETLIQALDESLRTGIRQVSIDVMAASKEPISLSWMPLPQSHQEQQKGSRSRILRPRFAKQ